RVWPFSDPDTRKAASSSRLLELEIERDEIALTRTLLEEPINAPDRPHARRRRDHHRETAGLAARGVDPLRAEHSREDLAQERAVTRELRLDAATPLVRLRVADAPAQVALHRFDR